ncbi:MAG: preprotein translocase subunit YajC [Campylobacteraceae bacterium]|jgi:preprotein translocase subunit YajC|nr:preprotein translocase subunit YajC [Campylobacteraceae bacterium]
MQEGNFLTSLLPLIVLIAIFYFLIILPQQRQAKAHRVMLSELKKGDKVITSGGLVGEVTNVDDNFIKIKLNDDVIVKIVKEHIAKRLDEK